MRDQKVCMKCDNREIAQIPGGTAWNGRPNKMKINNFKMIPVVRYICLSCGYTEEYIDNKEDLERVRSQFFTPEKDNDFV